MYQIIAVFEKKNCKRKMQINQEEWKISTLKKMDIYNFNKAIA